MYIIFIILAYRVKTRFQNSIFTYKRQGKLNKRKHQPLMAGNSTIERRRRKMLKNLALSIGNIKNLTYQRILLTRQRDVIIKVNSNKLPISQFSYVFLFFKSIN